MQLQQINLEREKFVHSQRQDELEMGVKMIETYQKLRKRGVSKAMIVATFPNMEKLAAADDSDVISVGSSNSQCCSMLNN